MSLLKKHAKELREMWQARCLRESKGKLGAVVLVALFHNYMEAMPVLLRVVYPGFRDIQRPFFCGPATIIKNGKVVCEMIGKDGSKSWQVVFDSEDELQTEFRNLADRLKLSDADRIEMTGAVRRWIVADLRVNHMGVKVA